MIKEGFQLPELLQNLKFKFRNTLELAGETFQSAISFDIFTLQKVSGAKV